MSTAKFHIIFTSIFEIYFCISFFIFLTNVISSYNFFQVKDRTAVHNTYSFGSHVMQYGDQNLNINNVFMYIGSNPANDNSTFIEDNSLPSFPRSVNQRDADLVYFWQKVCVYYKLIIIWNNSASSQWYSLDSCVLPSCYWKYI